MPADSVNENLPIRYTFHLSKWQTKDNLWGIGSTIHHNEIARVDQDDLHN